MVANSFLDTSFEIRWSQLTPEQIAPGIQHLLTEAQSAIHAIATLDLRELSYENTFLALEAATEPLNVAWGKVTHLQSVADSPPLRDAHNAMLPEVTEFFAGIPLNAALWERLKTFADSPASAAVTGIHRRFLDETVIDFKQQGADLSEEKRSRLEALQSELAQLTQKYSENVLDATNAWQLVVEEEQQLAGIPPHAKSAALRNAEAKHLGTPERPAWRFTLHMPSQEPFMTYLENGALRREMWEAAVGVGARSPYDNTDLIPKILALRAEKAALLGKGHFADLTIERRMAKSGARALEFIEDLERRTRSSFGAECRELETYKARQSGEIPTALAPWELAFWSEKLRRARYDLDEEQLRPYFPMDRVISGLFEIASRVFKLRIEEVAGDSVDLWDPLVKLYRLYDGSQRHLGSFYADWYPREGKRGGAWMNSFITGGPRPDGSRAPHLGLICGNMTPPDGAKPALLTHNEVETIFHEFGHLLHHLLGEVEIKSLNGTNVAWDFVELPSQIMENWCWERESLDLFARHFETGETILDPIFEKMIAAKNFRSASAMMRQVALAKMDLALHLKADEFARSPDIEAVARNLVKECLVPTEPPAPTIIKRFGHIFSDPVGYAAGYYSYKWAEVLDADAFTRFQLEGIFNAEVGAAFVEHILSKGNSRDPAELFRAFMGREPDLSALLRRSGLATA